MRFFKVVMATFVGLILFMAVVSLILALFVGVAVNQSESSEAIAEKTFLHLKLDQEITDQGGMAASPLDLGGLDLSPKAGLFDLLMAIERAKEDDRVKGIFLDLSAVPIGMASVQELRQALAEFKQEQPDKFVVSYADYYSQKAYYLASVADKVYLNPQGDLEFRGLASEVMFFTGALEKIGVEPQVIRHGKFKSAVEPFLLDSLSPENREQMNVFMGAIWNDMLAAISQSRGLSTEQLNGYADRLAVRGAKDAVELRLVDQLLYRDELRAELVALVGVASLDDLEPLSPERYSEEPLPRKGEGRGLEQDKVAVVFAYGEIGMGDGDGSTIGAATTARDLREAREDEHVKAIVFRVNSPGGSALASDIIWREARLAAQEKVLVVSMGDLAASGGYYIAAPADTILASPTTLTGSIGVFGLMLSAQKLLNEKMGITVDGVSTNAMSGIGSMTRPLTAEERAYFQESVEQTYSTFIGLVAEGRGMTTAEVDSIGQGRVWAGANAIELGLVDAFGGMTDAIELAAKMAGSESYRVVSLPAKKTPYEMVMEQFGASARAALMRDELGQAGPYYHELRRVMELEGIQARMTHQIEIR